MLENTNGAIKKGQSRETGNTGVTWRRKLATQGTHDEEEKPKTQHNMCWTPLDVNKHKQHKQDILQTTRGQDEPNIVFMRKS